MPEVSSEVKSFFEEFEQLSDTLDTDGMSRLYSDTFMAADPNGARPVPKAAFLAMLPKRKEMFASSGYASSTLTDITETPLDDSYVLVDTKWIMKALDPAKKQDIELASSFILRRTDNSFEIVFYLNHQDITAKLQSTN